MYAYKNSGLTKEQLTSLGVTGSKDSLSLPIQVPLFPPLLTKPLEIDRNVSMNYKLIWSENFRSRMVEIHSNSETVTADSFSSKVANALEKEHKKKLQFKLAWTQMPIELRNQSKRKSTSKVKPQLKKAKKAEMTDEKLEVLEQKEKLLKDDDEKSNKGDNDSDDELDDEEKGEDAELDDETDYINNYFDNGDGYFMDEDDNLDDGPVY